MNVCAPVTSRECLNISVNTALDECVVNYIYYEKKMKCTTNEHKHASTIRTQFLFGECPLRTSAAIITYETKIIFIKLNETNRLFLNIHKKQKIHILSACGRFVWQFKQKVKIEK